MSLFLATGPAVEGVAQTIATVIRNMNSKGDVLSSFSDVLGTDIKVCI